MSGILQSLLASRSSGASPNPPPTIEYLVVAGGGGGCDAESGGGGAGGFRTATGYSVTAGSPISITVGAGAPQGSSVYNYPAYAKGDDSVFGTITSLGGGTSSGNNVTNSYTNGGSGSGSNAGYGGSYFGTGTSGQ